MKVLAVNASPRKTGNTSKLLARALDGARSAGAETELVHLIDLDFKGCISCFSCKLKGGPSVGKCALRDDLTPILEKIPECGALIMGTPIYIGDTTGLLRSFLERLTFPYISYDAEGTMKFKGSVKTAYIYTMNCYPERSEIYDYIFSSHAHLMDFLNSEPEHMIYGDSYQFDDYSKYYSSRFDLARKKKSYAEEFPKICAEAFELGARLADK